MNVVMILIMFKISDGQGAELQKARCWKLEKRSRERPIEWRRNNTKPINYKDLPTNCRAIHTIPNSQHFTWRFTT